jgi:transmembrane sensor
MKEMKNNKNTGKEWEELASLLSGEMDEKEILNRFTDEDIHAIKDNWKGLRGMNTDDKIDVDKAWHNVYSKMQQHGIDKDQSRTRFTRMSFLRIAATVLILIGFAALGIYISKSGTLSKQVIVSATGDQRNLRIDLSDGSRVFLNRNAEISYSKNFGEEKREVKLTGEAYFEISADASKPFIIDAGKATVKVVGTSFNVITSNEKAEVEVFVTTGKVMLADKTSERSILLDPGFIGKINSAVSEKSVNNNPNYLAWNTSRLVYKGAKLDLVFRDLKKFFNMDIVVDDPSILQFPWTSPIDFESQDRIILLICTSFNLSYNKDGSVYHLDRK